MKEKYISNTVSIQDIKHQYNGVFDYMIYNVMQCINSDKTTKIQCNAMSGSMSVTKK